MKNLKLPMILISMFFMLFTSCKKEVKEEEKDSYIYAQQMFYATAVANKRDLEARQYEIETIIDAGNATSVLFAEKEDNQVEINKFTNFTEYMLGITPSIGPIGPINIPPLGCLHTANCMPIQNFSDKEGIVLNDDIEVTYVTLFDSEVGDIVNTFIPGDSFVPGDCFLPGDNFKEQDVWLFNSDVFTTNITKMTTTISIPGTENITLITPIVIE